MPWILRMTMTIVPFLLIGYLYWGWRSIYSVRQLWDLKSRKIFLLTFFFILFLNLFPLTVLIYFLGGNIRNLYIFQNSLRWPDFLLTFPFWFGLILVFEVLGYFLLLDITSFILNRFKLLNKQKIIKVFATLRILILVSFIFLVAYKIYSDTYTVRLDRHNILLRESHEDLHGLSISLVGDIQFDRYTQKYKSEKLSSVIKKAESDLLLFSGDLVTSGEHFIPMGIRFLRQQNVGMNHIACIGDHDYWANAERISNGLKENGWKFLENEHLLFPYKNANILVTGITQIYSQKISAEKLANLLKEAPPADLKILLVHQPSEHVLEIAAQHGYHLFLAGHTHGGQVVLGPFGLKFTPSQYENPFYSGFHIFQEMKVFITNGVGLTLAPVRYRAPAEVTQILIETR